MNNILYILAIVFIVLWAIGYFGYDAGQLIHVLVVIAIVMVLLRIISGRKIID